MCDNIIILAGGASSRMKKAPENIHDLSKSEVEQANNRSKGLIGVGPNGRPLMDYLLYNAKKAGYKNVYIVISEQGDMFKEFYGKKMQNNPFNGLSISFAIQYIPGNRIKPFGTADALCQTVEQYPDLKMQSYTVCNSDNLYSVNALLELRNTECPNGFIAYDRDALEFTNERISGFALVKLDHQNHLVNIVEKPSANEVENFLDKEGKLRVSMNAFKFNGEMFYTYLKNCPIHPDRQEKEIPTALLNMLQEHPREVYGFPLAEHVPDLTAKKDILEVKAYLKKHYPKLEWN